MNPTNLFLYYTLLIVFIFISLKSDAQVTKVKGIVHNEHNQVMPFVNISFVNSNVGTTTDFDGKYNLETKWASDSLKASFVGYKNEVHEIKKNQNQTINFKLHSTAINLASINIVENKKLKYKNRGNPAVNLIRRVIENKSKNHINSLDFYEFDRYEKVEFDLNNFSSKLSKHKFMKNFQFVFEDYVDTSEVNGKPFIPFFIREVASKIYFRQHPNTFKEYRLGTKMSGNLNRLDNEGIGHFMQKLYSEINIYDNQIELFGNQFPSPINEIAPLIYKFFIIDTLKVEDTWCINLGFSPRSKSDFAFLGNLYIVNDSSFAIRKVEMGINDNINLNFVNDLSIQQYFENINDELWVMTKNIIFIDYSFGDKQMGLVGKKSVSNRNFVINTPRNDSIYKANKDNVKSTANNSIIDNNFRHEKLNHSEEGIYTMIDSIQNTRTFKILNEASSILTSGWINCNWYELGTISTFVSWNKIEGLKLRIGGRTTPSFNKKYQIIGHTAIGLGDLRIKYLSGFKYSLNPNFLEYPSHHIYSTISRETQFPGQYSESLDNDNFLFSFNSSASDKMLLIHRLKIDYLKEYQSGFSFNIQFQNKRLKPLGMLVFIDQNGNRDQHINTDEICLKLSYAPNQKFYQTKNQRRLIKNKYPIFNISHTIGFSGFLNGEYNFSKSKIEISKRSYISLLGYSDIEIEIGKFWGQAPFPLLYIPIANQSIGYQFKAFNMMNYMEFINDTYLKLNWNHYFKGAIFNKLPLIKKLKIREVIGLKMLIGQLSEKNNPEVQPQLLQFPSNQLGQPTTFIMNEAPYLEASFGMTNILKFIRLDFVKRLNYLKEKHQVSSLFGVQGMGVKFSVKFDF